MFVVQGVPAIRTISTDHATHAIHIIDTRVARTTRTIRTTRATHATHATHTVYTVHTVHAVHAVHVVHTFQVVRVIQTILVTHVVKVSQDDGVTHTCIRGTTVRHVYPTSIVETVVRQVSVRGAIGFWWTGPMARRANPLVELVDHLDARLIRRTDRSHISHHLA